MLLNRDGEGIEDRFIEVLDGGPIRDGTSVLLPGARFLADAAELACREGATGALWPNDRRVAEIAPHLDRLALVALNFPSFRDGRAYSQARQLREVHGYCGELRATGEVLRDQLLFMLRAGFDSFEIRKASDAGTFAKAVARYSVFYQPSGDGRTRVASKRLARFGSARRQT